MSKKSDMFEAMKQQLISRSIESKKIKRIPLYDYIKKLIYDGKGMLTDDMVQKCKLISQDDYYIVRKERFLLNLNKKSKNVN